MLFDVNPENHEPIYSQIENGIKFAIIRGVWRAGEQIPSRREMAVELRVNPNTVVAAYKNLERAEILEMRRGRGFFVTAGARDVCRRSQGEVVQRKLAGLIGEAREADLSECDLRRLFEELMAERGSQTPDINTKQSGEEE